MLHMHIISFFLFILVSSDKICAYDVPSGLPCVDVPSCASFASSTNPGAELVIDRLSSGAESKKSSSVLLCHSSEGLVVQHDARNQTKETPSPYSTCNSAIFNLDVVEAFVTSTSLHCYSEIDLSPLNVPYEAGIYNPNLNHTNLQHTLLDCDRSGVKHKSSILKLEGFATWSSVITIPWELINCPPGCPERALQSCSEPPKKLRANFFRVVEKDHMDVENATCNSEVCEYMAWSPTQLSPPSFHEPNYFGYLTLI
jgi:hypothetical protein